MASLSPRTPASRGRQTAAGGCAALHRSLGFGVSIVRSALGLTHCMECVFPLAVKRSVVTQTQRHGYHAQPQQHARQ